MHSLRRTQVGAFTAGAATPLDALSEDNLLGLLVSSASALGGWPAHSADTEDAWNAVKAGRALPSVIPLGTEARILDASGDLIALGRADGQYLHPFKVFV